MCIIRLELILKKFKLKNSNFIINTKRLTIKNLPKNLDNGTLRAVIIKGMGFKGAKRVKQSGLIKVAIVKDKETRLGKGFAFVDFKDTDSALNCLRSMDNKEGGYGEGIGKRPIVEFSFDDIRKLHIQKQRELNLKKKQVSTPKPEAIPPTSAKDAESRKAVKKEIKKQKIVGRGKKQREKRRLARESAAGQADQKN